MSTPSATTSRVVTVTPAGPEQADAVVAVIHAAFGARPVLDPPSTALQETADSVGAVLSRHGGLLARVDDRPVGALLFDGADESLRLRRVSVVPDAQGHGVAKALARAAATVAGERGFRRLVLSARAELPATVGFWEALDYRTVAREGTFLTLVKDLPVVVTVETPDAMRSLGAAVATLLRPGDLLVLSGDLGAGKTTLTQGLGAGLGVRGDITSPTFVISRVHPSLTGGPALVHADAYRLGAGTEDAVVELEDLGLDETVEDSVTVVEWGVGLAERLTEDRLEVTIRRTTGRDGDDEEGADERRTVTVEAVGPRWRDVDLRPLLGAGGDTDRWDV
ncbi:MAG: tRNA threonylcarbamoyladenosine biosynthesis protein TsaE [Nocardioidaceae bacterium]|nr:tRNA threonylcarbamoyladenosine biosynthesis protein TsaE [Nocardioidaceae bacterium]